MKLSICIPTFNRARYIGETLESITTQLNSDVEIVIMDGASTDDTESVVARFKKQYHNILYVKANVNSGVDEDLAASINMAQGKYCWLMSSDDLLTPQAIDRILRELEAGYHIYLVNRTECTKELVPFQKQYWFPISREDSIFDIKDHYSIKNYLDSTNMIGALFSYIPCVIVCRQDWLSVQGSEQFFGSGYAHVYRLFSIFKRGCRLKYIKEQLVLCRMDNDSFSSKGLVNRYMLDFNGYANIGNKLFSNEIIKKAFLKVLIREHKWYRIVKLSSHITEDAQWAEVRGLLLEIGYSKFILIICRNLSKLKKIISLLVILKKKWH